MFLYTQMYDLSALTAEQIAREAMAILVEQTRVLQTFNRDFDGSFAEYGEIVNYNAPVDGTSRRRAEGAAFTFDTPSATGGSVKLNQNLYAGFEVTERQLQRSFADLREYFLVPHMRPVVEKLEKICVGQMYNTLAKGGSHISGNIGTTPTYPTFNAAKAALNKRNVLQERPLFVVSDHEAVITGIDRFIEYRMTGDGSPILNGMVSRGAGFDVVLANSMPEVTGACDNRVGAVNNAGGYPAGTTTLAVDGFTGAGVTGQWCTIDGVPYRLTGHTEAVADLTGITIAAPGLRDAVANDDVVIVYDGGAVNLVAGYAEGYVGTIIYDSFTADPQVGQGLCFGATTPMYSIIEVDTTAKTVLLNRPLEADVANDAVIHLTPPGKYSWSHNGPSEILVVRLQEIPSSLGIVGAIVDYQGLALRVMMSYNHAYTKYQISIDMLCGVATYDADFNQIIVS